MLEIQVTSVSWIWGLVEKDWVGFREPDNNLRHNSSMHGITSFQMAQPCDRVL